MSSIVRQSFGPGLWLFGAGGHAKVVIATLESAGVTAAGIFDDNPDLHGRSVLGIPVVGPRPAPNAPVDRDARALVAIGSNLARREIVRCYPALEWATAVHRSAVVHESVRLAPGTVVFANSVVQPLSKIGAHAILNTGAQVDHDCEIGDFVHVAPGSCLGGDVRLGEGAFLGVGCAVVPNVAVGAWTTVGAGAAVTGDLPAHATAVGVPARVIARRASSS